MKVSAYISWETYERIQAQLVDNYAEYSDRNKTRGVPRHGAAPPAWVSLLRRMWPKKWSQCCWCHPLYL